MSESDSEDNNDSKPAIKEVPKAKEQSKKLKEIKLVTDTELLARFYGNDDELDHKEKFLRSYILNEGWKEKASSQKKVDHLID